MSTKWNDPNGRNKHKQTFVSLSKNIVENKKKYKTQTVAKLFVLNANTKKKGNCKVFA